MIGHYAKGKTTLLRCLRGHSATSTFDSRTKRIGCDPDALSPDGMEFCMIIGGKSESTPSPTRESNERLLLCVCMQSYKNLPSIHKDFCL